MQRQSALLGALVALVASATAQAQTHPDETIDAVNVVWQAYGYEVYPSADPDTNQANIQWALDNVANDEVGEPGRVLLKSHPADDEDGFLAFDFGPTPDAIVPGDFNLLICNDVVLEGEIREDTYTTDNTSTDDPLLGQSRMTEIHGANIGINSWLSFLFCDPENCPACCDIPICTTDFAETVRVRNLVMRRPLYVAVWLGSGLEFPADADPVAHFLEESSFENLRIVGTVLDPTDDTSIPFIIHQDFGTVTIRDTYVDIAETETEPNLTMAIAVTEMLTAPWEEEPDLIPIGPLHVEIADNDLVVPPARRGSLGIVIFNPVDAIVTGNTIEAGLGIGARVHRHATIAENEINAYRVGFMGLYHDPLPEDVELPPTELPDGIAVRDNRVLIDPSRGLDTINPSAGVLGLYSAHVEGPDCWMGSTLGATFENNTFSGSADYGVYFGDLDVPGCDELVGDDTIADASSHNAFNSNDFSALKVNMAQVFLGQGASTNLFGVEGDHEGNAFGTALATADAAVDVWGSDNQFVGDSYPFDNWPEDLPLWLFRDTSSGNLVQDPVVPDCVDPADYFVDEGTGNRLVAEVICGADEGDAEPDAAPDAAPDASPDTAPDASPDTSADAAPDLVLRGGSNGGCSCTSARGANRLPALVMFSISFGLALLRRRRHA